MVVTKCPICQDALVGYAWAKTKTGKNWLKKGETWHDCPKKQFKRKTAGKSRKLTSYGLDIFPKEYDDNVPGVYCLDCGHHTDDDENQDKCSKCGSTSCSRELRHSPKPRDAYIEPKSNVYK